MSKSSSSKVGVWSYYAVFVFFLALEGAIVGGILTVAEHLGLDALGPWIAWALFVIGGTLLARFELRHINPDEVLRDPLTRFNCLLQRKLPTIGFTINSVIFGPMGAAIALKREPVDNNLETLCLISAILFASVWVPIFSTVWR